MITTFVMICEKLLPRLDSSNGHMGGLIHGSVLRLMIEAFGTVREMFSRM